MKGILLAGGSGSRLHPTTKVVSKQLLPVYNKPMIYYPLATLMEVGIKDILIISTPEDTPRIEELLGDGSDLGMNLYYKVQENPAGIAQAFLLGEDFIGNDSVCLILGDNIFYGNFGLQRAVKNFEGGATIFGYPVHDPERYGVVEMDEVGRIQGIVEKPIEPKSNLAIPGVYVYDNQVVDIAKKLKPSARGELEITDVNLVYMYLEELSVQVISNGVAWLDAGTPDSMLEASNFVATIEKRQGNLIACIEEIAYRKGFINKAKLREVVEKLPNSPYRQNIEDHFKLN